MNFMVYIFKVIHLCSPEGPDICALLLRHRADKIKNVGSGAMRSLQYRQTWWSSTATADDKPQQKLTLKFHSVLGNVRHSHDMTPQLCGTAGPVYK
jgi:hypothetical protein